MDIFIIEDDKSLSDEIKLVLNKWGYKVGQVNNFENITNEVLECNPKLILMDINLPSYDGFYWCSQIRNFMKLPIIFISSRDNDMVRRKEIGPVMMGRDHHDVSGTDSPFRETSNIKDGSNIMADMATHCFAGNCARGMSLVALHNGGGVGIGKAINGGFGMVLDGSRRVDDILRTSMPWDVMSGVARRAWARNENSITTVMEYNKMCEGKDHLTLPFIADDEMIDELVGDKEFE